MKYSHFLFFVFFSLLFYTSLSAQKSEGRAVPIFIDAEVGIMNSNDFNIHAQVALGAGYRITEQHAVGIEWRTAATHSCCNHFNMQGLGLSYRISHRKLLVKGSLGRVLNAKRSWDLDDVLTYQSGGYYLSTMAGIRFNSGIALGLGFIQSGNMSFDYFEPNWDSGELVLRGTEKVQFPTFTLTLAYAWH